MRSANWQLKPNGSRSQRARSTGSSHNFIHHNALDHNFQEMATSGLVVTATAPKSMKRATEWNEEVENAYRFQLAGYRDEMEYLAFNKVAEVTKWPHNGLVKKLVRRDGYFYYFNKARECPDKDIYKVKMYAY